MTELLLVRHGLTDWNVDRKVMGRQPIPLNSEGRAQARSLAKGLKEIPIHAVYVSPTKRTLQTAQILLKGRDPIPLVEDDGLVEVDFGDYVGKDLSELHASGIFQQYVKNPSSCDIPGGEKVVDVQRRAMASVDKMISKHAGERVVALSHGDVIKTILIHFLNMPFDCWHHLSIDTASMSLVKLGNDRTKVSVVNCHGDWGRYFRL